MRSDISATIFVANLLVLSLLAMTAAIQTVLVLPGRLLETMQYGSRVV